MRRGLTDAIVAQDKYPQRQLRLDLRVPANSARGLTAKTRNSTNREKTM